MGHAAYLRKALDVLFPTIPVQTGDAIGEPRVPRRSRSRYLSNAPGLADQLVASRKDSAREGGSCAAYFCKVPDLRKSELGLVRYGPANRGHRSVFGPFEGSFPIGIPASPDQLVASQEDSARKRGNVGGKNSRNFQQNLISSACFHARGRRRLPMSRIFARRIFSVFVFSYGCCAVRLGLRVPILPGSKWTFRGLRRIKRGAGRQFVARKGRLARRTPIDDQFSPTRPTGDNLAWMTIQVSNWMSGQGSGSGGPRRSDRLAKGKAVLYARDSSPDTDDEYDAMEDVRTRVDASIARDLQAELDAEAAVLGPLVHLASLLRRRQLLLPARSKRQRSDRAPLSADPIPEDYVAPGFRYPPQGGIRPRYPVTTPVVDTSLLTGLHSHPSSSVRRCEVFTILLRALVRGGWSEFCQLLEIARPEYRDFLVELGFGPFLSIRYVHVRHPLVRCWVERFFHHTGTIHLSTCEMGVLPVDWSAILGIRFGGRIPPSDPVSDFEALEILGIDDPAAIVGKKLFYLKISYLRDLLVREMEEPPTELRYRQWTAYFIFSCFLGNDKSTIPTPIVGMFRDIDDLRDYDWGALDFTLFWAFEHFAVFAPSRLPAAPDSVFPLARRWDSAWIQRLTVRTLTLSVVRRWIASGMLTSSFQPYSTFLLERPELGGEALVPVDPPQLMTIEDYIPRAPSDSFVAGVEAYPDLIRADVPYREWFEQVSLGPLMSLHETEILRLQLELSVSEDRHVADMDRAQGETARVQAELTQVQGEMAQMQVALTQSQRDLGSRDAALAAHAATIRRLEDQLHGYGHYSCYWSWLVRFRSDFFYATS
uniref:Aminotransferase-like plant mobile domain-containing protein n=1 Tax=Fagus sylvatica TaxID=28930 RepID=A0A2N9IQ64_FAGSY